MTAAVSPTEVFERYVVRAPDPFCWKWTGGKSSKGYGHPSIRRRRIYAHRLSYELHVGPIPSGKLIRHSCDNPECTNPAHLAPGTCADNSQDAVARRRTAAGSRNGFAILTEGAVRQIRQELGTSTNVAIAERWAVHPSTVSHIRCGRSWRHV